MGVRFNPVRFLVDDATKKLIVNDCFFFFFFLRDGIVLRGNGLCCLRVFYYLSKGYGREDNDGDGNGDYDVKMKRKGIYNSDRQAAGFGGGVGGGRTGNPAQSTFS